MPKYNIKYELTTYEFQVAGLTPGLAELKTCDLLWGKPMDEIIADAKITVSGEDGRIWRMTEDRKLVEEKKANG